MDGCVMHCDTTSSCQSAATSEIVKHFRAWVWLMQLDASSTTASYPTFTFAFTSHSLLLLTFDVLVSHKLVTCLLVTMLIRLLVLYYKSVNHTTLMMNLQQKRCITQWLLFFDLQIRHLSFVDFNFIKTSLTAAAHISSLVYFNVCSLSGLMLVFAW